MILAVSLPKMMYFFFVFGIIFAGIYVLAVLTPRLAGYIDKLRAKNKPFYESAPDPARVDTDSSETRSPAESNTDGTEN